MGTEGRIDESIIPSGSHNTNTPGKLENPYQQVLDQRTQLIFDEYVDTFKEMSPPVNFTYTRDPENGRYELQFEANGRVEKIAVPESSDGFKFASMKDMLNIIYRGIETKGAIFQNEEADALTELGRLVLWDDEKYQELPYTIVIDNQLVYRGNKQDNPFKFELGRKIENLCRTLVE